MNPMRKPSLLFLLTCFAFLSFQGQTPDFMFALEGTYVGQKEIPDATAGGGRRTLDARLDGRRNGAEDGFVLQWKLAKDVSNAQQTSDSVAVLMVTEQLETWHWDDNRGRLVITRIVDNKPIIEDWFVMDETSSRAVLERGGEWANAPALHRLTLERLAGQIRFERRVNAGDGKWTVVHRYMLNDFVQED